MKTILIKSFLSQYLVIKQSQIITYKYAALHIDIITGIHVYTNVRAPVRLPQSFYARIKRYMFEINAIFSRIYMHIFSIMRNIRVVDPSVTIEKRSDPDRTGLNIQIQNPNFNIFWSKLRIKRYLYHNDIDVYTQITSHEKCSG